MYCANCGTKNRDGASFCQKCGSSINKASNELAPEEISATSGITNYSPIFWKYFGLGVLLTIGARAIELSENDNLWIVYLILFGIYVYMFCKTINEAMLSIGKKNWWPLGLLTIIPFGFWIAFLIVRAKLKPHGKWVSEHKSFRLTK